MKNIQVRWTPESSFSHGPLFLYTTKKNIYGASLQNRGAKKNQVDVEEEKIQVRSQDPKLYY